MPVVTDQLLNYWNGKDGIKTGNTLQNIAPGAAAKAMTITGGTQLANGAIALDAVDDYMSAIVTGAPYETYGVPWTFELLYTPRTIGGTDLEIVDAGFYLLKVRTADMYTEAYHADGTNAAHEFLGITEFGTAVPMLLTLVCNGTSSIILYVNGVLKSTMTFSKQTAFSAGGYTTMALFQGNFGPKAAADVHAVRHYTKALTATEVAQNWNNGIEIGLAAPTAPLVPTGVFRAAGTVDLTVYDITDHPGERVRVQTAEGTMFIQLVETTDINASKIRTNTPQGIRALKK